MLERTISEHTGMRTCRERPEVELWVLCREEAAYFLWRLGKRPGTKQEGQLRPDVCAVMSFLSACGGKSAAILGCTETALPAALRAGGARTLTCVCPDHASARLLSTKTTGVRVVEGASGCTDLPDASQAAVIIALPAKTEKTERAESDLRGALYEAKRVLQMEGRLLVLAPVSLAASTLRKTQGVRVLERCDLTISGQQCALWVMTIREDAADSEL